MMLFPIHELLDEQRCHDYLLKVLYPAIATGLFLLLLLYGWKYVRSICPHLAIDLTEAFKESTISEVRIP